MKKVWITMRYISYEGGSVDSVWESEEASDLKVGKLRALHLRDVNYVTEEWEVGER